MRMVRSRQISHPSHMWEDIWENVPNQRILRRSKIGVKAGSDTRDFRKTPACIWLDPQRSHDGLELIKKVKTY